MIDALDGDGQTGRNPPADTDQVVAVSTASHFKDPFQDERFQQLAAHFESMFYSVSRAGYKGGVTRDNHTHDLVNDRCMLWCWDADRKDNDNTHDRGWCILPPNCFNLLMSWEDRCMLFSVPSGEVDYRSIRLYERVRSFRLTTDLRKSCRDVQQYRGCEIENFGLALFWPKQAQFCSRCFLKTSMLMDEGHYTYCSLCASRCHMELSGFVLEIVRRCVVVDSAGDSWWNYRGEHNTGFQHLEADEHVVRRQCPEHLMPRLDPPQQQSNKNSLSLSCMPDKSLERVSETLSVAFEWGDAFVQVGTPKFEFIFCDARLKRAVWSLRPGARCSKMYVSVSSNYIIMEVQSKYCGAMLPGSDATVVCLSYYRYPVGRFVTDHLLEIKSRYPDYHEGYSNDTDHVPVAHLCCDLCLNKSAHVRVYDESDGCVYYYCDSCLIWRTNHAPCSIKSANKPVDGVLWRASYGGSCPIMQK